MSSNFADNNLEETQPPPFFHGTELENPYLHIQQFEQWCLKEFKELFDENFCVNKIYLKILPYTLKDDAALWFDALPINSYTTWLEFQEIFFTMYLSTFLMQVQRQQLMKQQILNFSHFDGEAYYQAWERFNNLVFDCPHHGFHDEHLLQIFYTGLQPSTQDFVQMRSNGEFFEYSTEDTWWYLRDLAEYEKVALSGDPSGMYEDDGHNLFSFDNTMQQDQEKPEEPSFTSFRCDSMEFQEDHDDGLHWNQEGDVEDPFFGQNDEMDDGVRVSRMGDMMHFYVNEDEDKNSEGDCKMAYIEPELLPHPDLPHQPFFHPHEAINQSEQCTIIQGSSHRPIPFYSESQFSTPYILDTEYLHLNHVTFFDDQVWTNFIEHHSAPAWIDTARLTQSKGRHPKEILGAVLLEFKKVGGVSVSKQLAEERRVMIEQLPPPLDVLDPPFAKV